jgi:hypothetical protein
MPRVLISSVVRVFAQSKGPATPPPLSHLASLVRALWSDGTPSRGRRLATKSDKVLHSCLHIGTRRGSVTRGTHQTKPNQTPPSPLDLCDAGYRSPHRLCELAAEMSWDIPCTDSTGAQPIDSAESARTCHYRYEQMYVGYTPRVSSPPCGGNDSCTSLVA